MTLRDQFGRTGPGELGGRAGPGGQNPRDPRGDSEGNAARDRLRNRGTPIAPPAPPRSPGGTRTAPRQTPQDFPELYWSGDRAPLSIVYGRTRVRCFPWLFESTENGGKLVAGYVVASGEVEEIESLYINSIEYDDTADEFDGWEVETYTGTAGQTASPLLVAAIPGSPGYADDLPGIAYIVISAPVDTFSGLPQIEAMVKGRRVIDYRDSPAVATYSDNPALCLADLILSSDYGWDKALDTQSVIDAADACDEVVDGEARRRIGYALYDPRPTTDVVREVADLAGIMLDRSGNTIRFVPDRPRDVDLSINDVDHIASSRYSRTRTSRIPDAVEVSWYDPDTARQRDVRWPDTETDNLMRVRISGINYYSQALREAKERYNRARLEDLSADIVVAGIGSNIQFGDVINVTDRTISITDKPFRVMSVTIQSAGVHRLGLAEYQPAVYSDDFGADDVIGDTDASGFLRIPATPTEATNVGGSRTWANDESPRRGGDAHSWAVQIELAVSDGFTGLSGYKIEHYNSSSVLQASRFVPVEDLTINEFAPGAGAVILDRDKYRNGESVIVGRTLPGGTSGFSRVRAVGINGISSAALQSSTTTTGSALSPISGAAPSISASISGNQILITWNAQTALIMPDVWTIRIFEDASPLVELDSRAISVDLEALTFSVTLPKPDGASSYIGRITGRYEFTGITASYNDFAIS